MMSDDGNLYRISYTGKVRVVLRGRKGETVPSGGQNECQFKSRELGVQILLFHGMTVAN